MNNKTNKIITIAIQPSLYCFFKGVWQRRLAFPTDSSTPVDICNW